jgi:hypothetical protein
MKNSIKYALLIAGGNILLLFILIGIANSLGDSEAAFITLLGVPAILGLLELVLGIVFAAGETKKDLGAGLLIGLGITLLIGLSIC